MRNRTRSIPSLTLMLLLPGMLLSERRAHAATTLYVDNVRGCAGLVPCFRTIMDAVTAAAPYDSIEVFDGVYREGVVFDRTKNDIVLRAHVRSLMPVIEAPSDTERAVTLRSPGVQVRNFVLDGGLTALISHEADARDAVIHANLVKGGIVFRGCIGSAVTKNSVLDGGISLLGSEGIGGRSCLVDGNTVDGASIQLGISDYSFSLNVVRRNVVRGGGILFTNGYEGNTVESNRVYGGSITLMGIWRNDRNVIRHNVVRRGGILLGLQFGGSALGRNIIESNFVSGNAGDGITLRASDGGATLVRKNTSVENAYCDINDTQRLGPQKNTWTKNRFGTSCGAASE